MKKPKVTRQSSHAKKRLGTKWRKPRGIDSKQKKGIKAKGAKPTVGYGTPKTEKPLLVRNMADLEKATGKITLSSKLGNKKREEIIKQAETKKLEITNR